MLAAEPALAAPAVAAFYEREPADMAAAARQRRYPPEVGWLLCLLAGLFPLESVLVLCDLPWQRPQQYINADHRVTLKSYINPAIGVKVAAAELARCRSLVRAAC